MHFYQNALMHAYELETLKYSQNKTIMNMKLEHGLLRIIRGYQHSQKPILKLTQYPPIES